MELLEKSTENIIGLLLILATLFGCGSSPGNPEAIILAEDSLGTDLGVERHTVEKIWETEDPVLAHPECVLVDSGILFVSLVNGGAYDVDGKGAIAQLDRNGNIINAKWVTGLDAPKGMGVWNMRLYVTDMSKVVVINIVTGKIESTIPIRGTTGLNDVAFDSSGTMYVSDVRLGRVYRIANGIIETYLTNLAGANGLKVIDGILYVLVNNALLSVMPNKELIVETALEPGGDGIQSVGKNEFLITRYMGVMYYLDKKKTLQTLLDTRDQMISTADIDYDPAQRIIYVPTLAKNSVVAYRLR